ncbi:MAG: LysM peptidoglycan-binding domain-containing protein [Eubacteriales bacterium]|nr:LysM peptidoglycan-binding domain-containing protein [Eubacteriales bacterium]
MIEVIYKEEKKEGRGNECLFRLPKNIRQIGLLSEHYKIYMEDYVNTFLKKLSDEAVLGARAALLLGQVNFLDGVTYVFIRCALLIEEKMSLENISFTEKTWVHLNENMEKYFPDQDVVGWFYSESGLAMEVENMLYKIHLTHFGGGSKVLFLMEAQEKEEAFFRYENGQMYRQPGYYIYYERNPLMQAYMIAQNENQSLESKDEVQDKAVKDFRKIILGKKEEDSEEEEASSGGWFTFAASAALAIAVLAVGSNFLGSYQKMQSARQQAQEVSAQIESRRTTPTQTPSALTITPMPSASSVPEETPRLTQALATVSPSLDNSLMQEVEQETASDKTLKTYEIQDGDTLNNICMELYGDMDMVERICEINNISEPETIYPGQIIVLP